MRRQASIGEKDRKAVADMKAQAKGRHKRRIVSKNKVERYQPDSIILSPAWRC